MRTPFTEEQFFRVFSEYNLAVWPTQTALLALAMVGLLAVRRAPGSSRWIAFGVSVLWSWMALGYHVVFFTRINPAAFGFGALFLAQSALIFWHGWRTRRLEIGYPASAGTRALGWVLIAYGLAIYPAIAYMVGQRYPALPTFGLPCPTTIFTLGLFAWATKPVPWSLLVIPTLWAAIGTSAAASLHVPQDFALPAAAAAVLLARWMQRRPRTRVMVHA